MNGRGDRGLRTVKRQRRTGDRGAGHALEMSLQFRDRHFGNVPYPPRILGCYDDITLEYAPLVQHRTALDAGHEWRASGRERRIRRGGFGPEAPATGVLAIKLGGGSNAALPSLLIAFRDEALRKQRITAVEDRLNRRRHDSRAAQRLIHTLPRERIERHGGITD